ncbi:hypothetical protein OG226_02980 [Streptomyces sp. NBC_01261]|uniref:hypothetical protein n=1 Tax=Streptomyces sp. NBC_01261 TaxID=2903802 RepID=UPI002E31BAB5|nr:hypothetical protein [Streptomyces sp. NBC_01261]
MGSIGDGCGVSGDGSAEVGGWPGGGFGLGAGAAGGGRAAFAFVGRPPGGLLASAHQAFQVGQLLDDLVGGGGAQLVETGTPGGERGVGRLGAWLGGGPLLSGRRQVHGGGGQ